VLIGYGRRTVAWTGRWSLGNWPSEWNVLMLARRMVTVGEVRIQSIRSPFGVSGR
jgi:hypothetical protein